MSKITELARGQITTTEALVVILVQPEDMPPEVIIHWPVMPTVLAPRAFSAAANVVMRALAAAGIRLAALRKEQRL